MRATAFIALALTVLAITGPAAADEVDECIQAYEEAQTLRLDRKLIEAHEKLAICTRANCPAAVTMDCWRWLSETEDAMPALAISVQNLDGGSDITTATVTLDGKALTGEWMGKAVPVNPGQHVLRAEAEGYAGAEETVVAREGEKSRVVTLKLRSLTAPPPTAGAGSAAPVDDGPVLKNRWPAYVLGGVGLAVIGGAAAIGTIGYQDAKDMGKTEAEGGCKPNCASQDVDAAHTKLLVANIGFGVGAAAVAAGLIWLLLSKPSSSSTETAAHERLHLMVEVDPSSASGVTGIRGAF